MLMSRIEGATRELGKPKDWPEDKPCMTLPIRDVLVGGEPCMLSAWQPDPVELKRLANGASVYLWVYGTGHPPVSVTVGQTIENDTGLGLMWYDKDAGALMCDREIPGVTRKYGLGHFIGESMGLTAAKTIALAMGYAFRGPADGQD